MAYPVVDFLAYFAGQWHAERDIHGGVGEPDGKFVGTATFTPETDGDGVVLRYFEQGRLRLGEHEGPAHRQLRYHITGHGQADVYFSHGGFFHDVDLRDGQWRSSHPCRDDLYRGEYTVLTADQWELTWQVAGPTKNHTMTTLFDRGDGKTR